mmetsp:Transcript_27161/g.67348  ORF Transcript_27161/g.67348 Transcript_27161/m.67348 type:complete len:250 (+) Transcript_27161:732-1481(+)
MLASAHGVQPRTELDCLRQLREDVVLADLRHEAGGGEEVAHRPFAAAEDELQHALLARPLQILEHAQRRDVDVVDRREVDDEGAHLLVGVEPLAARGGSILLARRGLVRRRAGDAPPRAAGRARGETLRRVGLLARRQQRVAPLPPLGGLQRLDDRREEVVLVGEVQRRVEAEDGGAGDVLRLLEPADVAIDVGPWQSAEKHMVGPRGLHDDGDHGGEHANAYAHLDAKQQREAEGDHPGVEVRPLHLV